MPIGRMTVNGKNNPAHAQWSYNAHMDTPTPMMIKEARTSAGQSQTEAGAAVGAALRTWQHWEMGTRAMPSGLWELYLLKTGQHPSLSISPR